MIEKLQRIGMSRNEAVIYLVLTRKGGLSPGQICTETGINRTTVYDTVRRLIQKGYVNTIITGNRRLFPPATPKSIIEQIQDQEKVARELQSDLSAIAMDKNDNEQISIL